MHYGVARGPWKCGLLSSPAFSSGKLGRAGVAGPNGALARQHIRQNGKTIVMKRYRGETHTHRLRYMRDLLWQLVGRDFKLRYKRSAFGVGWSLLVPLAQLAVFYLVFNQLVPLSIPHYTSFLFTGLLPWTWFHSSLTIGAATIVENRELVRQAGFPTAMLPPVS